MDENELVKPLLIKARVILTFTKLVCPDSPIDDTI